VAPLHHGQCGCHFWLVNLSNEFGVGERLVVEVGSQLGQMALSMVRCGRRSYWVDDESDVSDERLMKAQFEFQNDYDHERWLPSAVRVVAPDVRLDFSFAIVEAQ